MAVGKNKRISKNKKGGKKKVGDTFLRKEWYDLRAPSTFTTRAIGKTCVTKTQGTRLAADGLKLRVYEVNLADLAGGEEEQAYRKILLRCEDVQGKQCLTDFHGMDVTRNHAQSLVRKWQSLIEGSADLRTTDGYTLRVFVVAFTKRQRNQVRNNCYAQNSKIKAIRKRMMTVLSDEITKSSLKELVGRKFPHNTIEKEMTRATTSIFPLQNIYIRKVKVVKRPKFDMTKFMELHGDAASEDAGRTVVPVAAEAQNLLTAEME